MRSWLSVLITDAESKKVFDIPIAPSLYSLSNKMDNSLLVVRDINHKYIVVERRGCLGLQVWMPMIGNINNQGLSNLSYFSGKYVQGTCSTFGKCLNVPNSSPISFTADGLVNAKKFSVCFWTLADNSTKADWNQMLILGDKKTDGSYGSNFRFESCTTYPRACSFHNNDICAITARSRILGSSNGTWYHVCVTYDGTELKSYTNGNLIGTDVGNGGYLTGYVQIGSANYFGLMNDLRIYDEVISQKQIRGIYNLQIIHYPLNNIYEVGINDGNLFVAKTTTTGSLSVSNTSTFNGATTFNSTLTCKSTSTFTGSLKAGSFTFRDYSEIDDNNIIYRRPVASAGSNKSRVAILQGTSNNKIIIKAQYNSTNFTNVTFTGSSSDVRLKKDIKDSSVNALSKIMQMQIREFNWKQSGVHQELGCVADELELIDPLLTVGGGYDDDGTMNIKSIDTLLLSEYAIKGIQELYRQNKQQQKRIEYLELQLNNK